MAEIALYGSVSLKRGRCRSCGGSSFVIDGKLQCCGKTYTDGARSYRRMTSPRNERVKPSRDAQLAILTKQKSQCLYCGLDFGSVVWRGARFKTLKAVWDHFVPFAYSQNNTDENFVASCQVCNGIKSDRVFETLEEARAFINQRREKKGYEAA